MNLAATPCFGFNTIAVVLTRTIQVVSASFSLWFQHEVLRVRNGSLHDSLSGLLRGVIEAP